MPETDTRPENPPAFPRDGVYSNGHNDWYDWPEYGMDLLDYFAGKAMKAVSVDDHATTWDEEENDDAFAKRCYDIAEAFLRERERRQKERK